MQAARTRTSDQCGPAVREPTRRQKRRARPPANRTAAAHLVFCGDCADHGIFQRGLRGRGHVELHIRPGAEWRESRHRHALSRGGVGQAEGRMRREEPVGGGGSGGLEQDGWARVHASGQRRAPASGATGACGAGLHGARLSVLEHAMSHAPRWPHGPPTQRHEE
eukprot:scaffold7987_cov105-Isochrysis_galbana.AAC.3